tara:strand:- start:381 stop:626 length:246 start_codon:yes stop_codon:yes gene_type:complete
MTKINYKAKKMQGEDRDVYDISYGEETDFGNTIEIKNHYTEEEVEAFIAKEELEISKHEELKTHWETIKEEIRKVKGMMEA